MNDTTLNQLKILVERAVRPVRASTSRKRKMREELLAHVTAVFEAEATHADERAALECTAARFGAPEQLTRQLQASLPAGDQFAAQVETLIGFPPRRSKLRLAFRHAVLVAAIATAALVLMVGSKIVATREWTEWLTLARLPAMLAPVNMAVLMFFASLLGQGMTEALLNPRKRSWPRILAIGVGAWLLVPVWLLGLVFAITGLFVSSIIDVAPLLLTSLLAPLALGVIVAAIRPELRHYEEWASLKLD
jgi:hypothetical protein